MLQNKSKSDLIFEILVEKGELKQKVFDNTYAAFKTIKKILNEITKEFNERLKDHDQRIALEYRNVSLFQCELKIAGDRLVFYMHSNVFQFDRDHYIWKIPYIKRNPNATYSGIINIYNFLNDSFKYNRKDDLGYLIGRIFINKDNNYFVEGKQQMDYLSEKFGNEKLTKEKLRGIIENAILYSLKFDLLVPPYEAMKTITVEQILEARRQGIQTGKRLGFSFNADDVKGEKLLYTGG